MENGKRNVKRLLCCIAMVVLVALFTGTAMAAESSQITATVPAFLPVTVDSQGEATVSDEAVITNGSSFGLAVSSVQVIPGNGWTLVDYDHDFNTDKVNQRNIAFQVNNQSAGADGRITIPDWRVPAGGSSAVQYACKLSAQGAHMTNKAAATVTFCVEWDGYWKTVWRLPSGDVTLWLKTPSADAYPNGTPVLDSDPNATFLGWEEVSKDEGGKVVVYEPNWKPSLDWETMPIPATFTLDKPKLEFSDDVATYRVVATLSDIRELGLLTSVEEFASFFPGDLDIGKCNFLTEDQKNAISQMDEEARRSYRSDAIKNLSVTKQFVWRTEGDDRPTKASSSSTDSSSGDTGNSSSSGSSTGGGLTMEEILAQLGGGAGGTVSIDKNSANDFIKIEVVDYSIRDAAEGRAPSISCDVDISWVYSGAGKTSYTVFLKDSPLTVTGTAQKAGLADHAILYSDGTLVFQWGEEADSSHGSVVGRYTGFDTTTYTSYSKVPWYNNRTSIKYVEFEDKTAPVSTAYWFYGCYNLNSITGSGKFNASGVTSTEYMFSDCTALKGISGLSNWDTSSVKYMGCMFYNCSSLTNIPYLANWDTGSAVDMSGMFSGCTKLRNISPLANWDVSSVTSIGSMFYGCGNLTNISPLTNWNTSNLRTMNNMFYNCTTLADTSPLANWDTKGVTEASAMFSGCTSLINISGLTNWDVSNMTGASSMFYNCTNLTNISPLTNWDTGNMMYMSSMFSYCTNLTNISPLANWNTGSVTYMGSMFSYCTNLTDASSLANWNTDSAIDMGYMFYNCTNLTTLNCSNWNTKQVGSMRDMFYNCYHLQTVALGPNFTFNGSDAERLTDLPTPSSAYIPGANGNWYNKAGTGFTPDTIPNNTAATYSAIPPADHVLLYSDGTLVFQNGTEVDSSHGTMSASYTGFNTTTYSSYSSVPWYAKRTSIKAVEFKDKTAPVSTKYWFYGCTALTSVTGADKFDASGVTSMYYMFYNCTALADISGLAGWDTSAVTNLYGMFYNCTKLANISALAGWDTSAVTNMYYLFRSCTSLTNVSALANWDTGKVTDMSYIFYGCTALTDASALARWDTGKVTTMGYMFYNCTALTTLDCSNWNTKTVGTMTSMFYNCYHLQTVTLGANFTFNGSGTSRKINLPTPSSTYITGATGSWYNKAGTAFSPSTVPNNVADTYYAIKPVTPEELTYDISIYLDETYSEYNSNGAFRVAVFAKTDCKLSEPVTVNFWNPTDLSSTDCVLLEVDGGYAGECIVSMSWRYGHYFTLSEISINNNYAGRIENTPSSPQVSTANSGYSLTVSSTDDMVAVAASFDDNVVEIQPPDQEPAEPSPEPSEDVGQDPPENTKPPDPTPAPEPTAPKDSLPDEDTDGTEDTPPETPDVTPEPESEDAEVVELEPEVEPELEKAEPEEVVVVLEPILVQSMASAPFKVTAKNSLIGMAKSQGLLPQPVYLPTLLLRKTI